MIALSGMVYSIRHLRHSLTDVDPDVSHATAFNGAMGRAARPLTRPME
jgi:hypothetical protein